MKIHYRDAAGNGRTTESLAELERLVVMGSILPETPIYNPATAAWMRASDHPICGSLFEGGVAVSPGNPAPDAGLGGVGNPGPLPAEGPDHAILFRAVAIPACFLLLGGSLWLAMGTGEGRAVQIIRSVGIALALASMAFVCAAGLFRQLRRDRRSGWIAGLSLLPGFLLVGSVLYLVRPGPAPAEGQGTQRHGTEIPKSAPPAAVKMPHAEEATGSTDTSVIRASLKQYLDTVDAARAQYLEDLHREDLRGALQQKQLWSEKSTRAAHTKLKHASQLMDAYYNRVISLNSDLQSKLEILPIDAPVRLELMEYLEESRNVQIHQLEEWRTLLTDSYREADRYLIALDEVLARSRRSQRDSQLMWENTQRLADLAAQLESVMFQREAEAKQITEELRQKLDHTFPPPA